jgi:uncharacterized membrane protein YgcG
LLSDVLKNSTEVKNNISSSIKSSVDDIIKVGHERTRECASKSRGCQLPAEWDTIQVYSFIAEVRDLRNWRDTSSADHTPRSVSGDCEIESCQVDTSETWNGGIATSSRGGSGSMGRRGGTTVCGSGSAGGGASGGGGSGSTASSDKALVVISVKLGADIGRLASCSASPANTTWRWVSLPLLA